jgi:hypothetical protein
MWSLAIRVEHRGKKSIDNRRILYKENLNNPYYSPNIIRIKLTRTKWAEYTPYAGVYLFLILSWECRVKMAQVDFRSRKLQYLHSMIFTPLYRL